MLTSGNQTPSIIAEAAFAVVTFRNELRTATPAGIVSGVYADLVTALGFKPMVRPEKASGGFDSHPLPLQFDARHNLLRSNWL